MSQASIVRQNQGKRRRINPENHKDFVAKRNKNAGLPYRGRNGNFHPGLQPPSVVCYCNKNLKIKISNPLILQGKICTNRCTKPGCLLPYQEKLEIFQSFRQGDYNEQNLLIAAGLRLIDPREPTNPSRRKFTTLYTLPAKGKRVQVCKQTFLDVLKISGDRVWTVTSKLKDGDMLLQDLRGRHSKNKIGEDIRQRIRDHIKRFPTVESHYGRNRGQNSNRYLEPGLNVEKMYSMFIEESRAADLEECECWVYRDVFFKDFKLSFSMPKQDTCDVCDKNKVEIAKENDPIQKAAIEERHAAHVLLSK